MRGNVRVNESALLHVLLVEVVLFGCCEGLRDVSVVCDALLVSVVMVFLACSARLENNAVSSRVTRRAPSEHE